MKPVYYLILILACTGLYSCSTARFDNISTGNHPLTITGKGIGHGPVAPVVVGEEAVVALPAKNADTFPLSLTAVNAPLAVAIKRNHHNKTRLPIIERPVAQSLLASTHKYTIVTSAATQHHGFGHLLTNLFSRLFDPNYLIMQNFAALLILTIILPPLGVGLGFGISKRFWICLGLTILFYLPGLIYGLVILVNKFY